MKSKKMLKMAFLVVFLYIIISCFCYTNAATLSEMKTQTDAFLKKGQTASDGIDYNNGIKGIIDIGSILTTIGIAVMIGVTIYMGIKYLTSGPDGKAKLKTQLIGLLVSGLVIFGAYYIWKLVIDIASKF